MTKVTIDLQTPRELKRSNLSPGTIFIYKAFPTEIHIALEPIGMPIGIQRGATASVDVCIGTVPGPSQVEAPGSWRDAFVDHPVIVMDIQARTAEQQQ
jgi:hypothetical protein